MSKSAQPRYFNYDKRCPKCHSRTEIVVNGPGGWSEDRVCTGVQDRNGKKHKFHVEYNNSNDPGEITWPGEAHHESSWRSGGR